MNVDRVTSESLVSKPGIMEGQSRQDLLLRIYEKTKTIPPEGGGPFEAHRRYRVVNLTTEWGR